jgi:PAS domain S-box-containing protein
MRVGEVAKRTGVGVSTLRAWERRFGFPDPERSPSGQRVYTETDIERVNAVSRLVAEGLTLSAAMTRVAGAGTVAPSGGEAEAFLLHQVMQAADQGIWVSQDGRTRYVNRRMAEMMRCSIEELLERPVLDFYDPELADDVRERARIGRGGVNQRYEIRLRRADGTSFLAETATTPLLSSAGSYQGAVAVVTDITERMEAEAASRFQRALLDAIGEAVVGAIPDGTIVYANPAAERLFGWKIDELIGQNGLNLLPTEDASNDSQRIHTRILRKRVYSGDLELTRRDGTRFTAHLTGSPVLDAGGHLVGLIATLIDNTERNRLKHELLMQEQELETLALLGKRAHTGTPDELDVILTEAIEAIRRVLRCEFAYLLEYVPGGDAIVMRFASGDLLDTEQFDVIQPGSRSLAGYTALSGTVVLVDDASRDRRFDRSAHAAEVGLMSAAAAPVFAGTRVVGVVIAGSSERRQFSRSASQFIQSMANVVGVALRSA